uniref:Uncharacterized protein n=1 Tax=Erpetoichthys calabaricus TaxID=27687 RepID=A0A8C4S779_ERPCA
SQGVCGAYPTSHWWMSTYPLQELQRTFLLSCSLVAFPLYRSSRFTLFQTNKISLEDYSSLKRSSACSSIFNTNAQE